VTRARISRHLWEQRRTLRHYIVEMEDPETGRKYLMAEERLFGPPGIRRILRKAGLEVERVVMSGFLVPQLLRTPANARVLSLERALASIPLAREFGGFYTAIAKRA
jgi:hypothetical protein